MNLWAFGLSIAIVTLIFILITILSRYHKCKYGEVQEDGFQYCEKCNKAITPGIQPCQHKWKTIETSPITTFGRLGDRGKRITIGKLYIQECEKCGTMQDYITNVRG